MIAALYNAIHGVMKNERFMTAADRIELAEIEADVESNRKRRARLMNRLRQRAYKERTGK